MDNDLFSATETLNTAFKEVLKSNEPKNKYGMRAMFVRLKKAIEQRNLTVSEKLLLCYDFDEKDLFASRDTKKRKFEDNREKAIAAHNEDKLLWDAFRKLPKPERDRIWKEMGMDKMFPLEEEPLDNNTTTPFEHNKNKGGKNGK